MADNWKPGEMHRCEECIRPICQRKLTLKHRFEQVSEPMNEYAMHDLFAGV